ncbi:MAG: sulfotransferase [Rhodocyclales bacterium]|nr:sulfotransferase [Rhodocyclales bacterium]
MKPIPLIISGPPRSGTTFFSALLDGHEQVNWLPDEGFFFEHIHNLGAVSRELFLDAARLDVDTYVDGVRDRSLFPLTHRPFSDFPTLDYQWDESLFRRLLALDQCQSLDELWVVTSTAYLAALGQSHSGKFTCMKAADYGRSVFGALGLIPDAKGIVVVREPKAALNSLHQYRLNRNEKLLSWPTLVHAMAAMNSLAEASMQAIGDERLHVVRYEDLLADQRGVMERLCQWLDIPFSEALMAPSMLGQPWTNNSSFGAGTGGTGLEMQRQDVLSPAKRVLIDRHLGPFRKAFRYE